MKRIVDINSWSRKNSYEFFKTFQNPNISITSEVSCSHAMTVAKDKSESFFIYYIYAMLCAMNEIEEFRYRIDAEGQILYYDQIDITTPIILNEEGDCAIVRIPLLDDFDTFYQHASAIISAAKQQTESNFDTSILDTETDPYGTIFLSATPDLYFTALVGAQEKREGNSYPLLNVGKAIMREGELVMPVAITISHVFADGLHISRFFTKINERLSQF